MLYRREDLQTRELLPGFTARMIHTERMSIAFWEIKAGAELPEHAHDHEQVAQVITGQFELWLGEQCYVLGAGDTLVIPSRVPHRGKALSDCTLQDTFAPVREDFLTLE